MSYSTCVGCLAPILDSEFSISVFRNKIYHRVPLGVPGIHSIEHYNRFGEWKPPSHNNFPDIFSVLAATLSPSKRILNNATRQSKMEVSRFDLRPWLIFLTILENTGSTVQTFENCLNFAPTRRWRAVELVSLVVMTILEQICVSKLIITLFVLLYQMFL